VRLPLVSAHTENILERKRSTSGDGDEDPEGDEPSIAKNALPRTRQKSNRPVEKGDTRARKSKMPSDSAADGMLSLLSENPRRNTKRNTRG
jgi:hypothetical protein